MLDEDKLRNKTARYALYKEDHINAVNDFQAGYREGYEQAREDLHVMTQEVLLQEEQLAARDMRIADLRKSLAYYADYKYNNPDYPLYGGAYEATKALAADDEAAKEQCS